MVSNDLDGDIAVTSEAQNIKAEIGPHDLLGWIAMFIVIGV